jgi:hypothetical protein
VSDTSPRDQSALLWNAKKATARTPRPGEMLFAFQHGADAYRCELRDHGEFGVEAQFLLNGELYIARTFQDEPILAVRARELAIAWAEQQRGAMEKGQG